MVANTYSIFPEGSTILTPLSLTGLCEAVMTTPTAFPFKNRDRVAAKMPTRGAAPVSFAASHLKPAVPYE